ncbi:MAG: SLC13 family permease [Candidatus Dormibacteria bacterium]
MVFNPVMRERTTLLFLGALGAVGAFSLNRTAAFDATAHTWPPFVLVIGLLLIGCVANTDGLFTHTARLVGRLPGSGHLLFAASMALVAVVTVFLNLDTSVAFLTPVLVLVARRRGLTEQRFLYGCVFMSNAASLLLPGSNLTNVLVLANQPVTGSVYLARMVGPWVAAVGVTGLGVAFIFRERRVDPLEGDDPAPSRPLLSMFGVVLGAVLVVMLPDAALPILGIGLSLVAVRVGQQRMQIRHIGRTVDVVSITGVFLVAVTLGTLARLWSYPAELMRTSSEVATAVIAAGSSVLVNNLPAAVLLGSRSPAHPGALLVGLDVGPNLAVSGSLSALIWWQAARSVGARPSVLRYSLAGAVLAPAALAAALVALRLVSPGSP